MPAEPAESTSAGSGLLDAALGYAARGWPVMPIAPRGKVPLTAHGLKDATVDADVITLWWNRRPDANVGIATSSPGPTVIDCDGPLGKRAWSKFVAGVGWAGDPWCCTGGGGWHIYYVGDPEIRNRAGWLEHVDVRGVGGYVVAPPSIHASGGDYWWVHGPDERDLAPSPTKVRNALLAPTLTVASTPRLRIARGMDSKYAAAALDGELAKVRGASEGARNSMLVAASFSVGQLVAGGDLDLVHVAAELLAAATLVGLATSEAGRTIASGLRAGIANPRRR